MPGLSIGLSVGAIEGRGASVATPWTPEILGATVLAWYQGDDLTGADAAAITNWPDSSGNGNDATNGSGAATKRTNVLNSLPVARFPGFSNAQSVLNVPNIYSGKTAAAAFCVLKRDADPPAIGEQCGIWTFGSDSSADNFPFTNGQIYDGFCSTARKTTGVDPTPSLTSAFRICSWHSTASDFRIYIDGVQIYTTGTNTFGATSSPKIGFSIDGNTTFDGDMAEIILCDTVLSQANREYVEGYLAHKWFGAGGSNNLDSGHPYKTAPPTV